MTRAINDKAKLIIVLLLATVVALGLIMLTAYSTSVQYEINNINSQIKTAEWKQRNLEAQIKTATNVANLEDRALELGLVYPSFDETVYLQGEETETVHDFATALIERTYK